MGAKEKEQREARDAGVPPAWVWSQYRGERRQSDGEQHGSVADEDPMLFEERGLHPLMTALCLAMAVAIILGLVWLFTSPPS
jgi:hypothetical protein